MTQRLHKEWRPEEMIKIECCMPSLRKNGKLEMERNVERYGRAKKYDQRVINWGKQQVLFLQIPLFVPLSSEIRILLSSGYREDNFLMRNLLPASQEDLKGILTHAISQISSDDIFSTPRCFIWGQYILEIHYEYTIIANWNPHFVFY